MISGPGRRGGRRMTPGVEPLHGGRMVQPDVVVMGVRLRALAMGHRRAEELARFQLIESLDNYPRDRRVILLAISGYSPC
jgi:hypothetical protein